MSATVIPDARSDMHATHLVPGSEPVVGRAAIEAPVVDEPTAIAADRADAPVSVVAERFLRAIVAVVPLELLEELHLFSPLRQGVTETGIAVVAAREVVTVGDDLDAVMTPEFALDDPPPASEASGEPDTSPYKEYNAVYGDDGVEPFDVDETSVAPVTAFAPRVRHTIYTARYRLVIKGAERGKWEADVVAEAEAPLITVEAVVRGVQRRAGEDSAITRFSAAQVTHALRLAPVDRTVSSTEQ